MAKVRLKFDEGWLLEKDHPLGKEFEVPDKLLEQWHAARKAYENIEDQVLEVIGGEEAVE